MENTEIIKLLENMKRVAEGCKASECRNFENERAEMYRNGQIATLNTLIKAFSDEETMKSLMWLYTVDHKGESK
ncbi:MAG: hypothetical protein IKY67_06430 [Paludibacteraceae bacterium]|nr:hypothetical protein [Paludibacteraceae bacterium]